MCHDRRRGTTGMGSQTPSAGNGTAPHHAHVVSRTRNCRMNLKITAALAIMTAALAPAAFSQEQTETRGFYVGGGIGQFNAQIDDVDQVDNTIDKWKEDDTAYKFFAGYRMNP